MEETAAPPPSKIRFYDGGEEFMILGDASKYCSRTVGSLGNEYPSLYRRQANIAERAHISGFYFSRNPIITLTRASEINSIYNKDSIQETLRDIPLRYERRVTSSFGDVLLTQSSNVPPTPLRPATGAAPSRPKNPLAPFYRYADGMASPSDDMTEVLAPIRVAIDQDGVKFRDTFTWNVNDSTLKILVQDAELPNSFAALITAAIETQIEEFVSLQEIPVALRPFVVNIELPYCGGMLRDRFVWDPREPLNNPEDFAASIGRDLGLGGDLIAAVACSIREQMQQDRKAIVSEDSTAPEAPVPTSTSDLFRVSDLDDWTPAVLMLSQSERDRKFQEGERESRWRRRAARETDKSKPYAARGKPVRGRGGRGRGGGRLIAQDDTSVHTSQAPSTQLVLPPASELSHPSQHTLLSTPVPRLGPALPYSARPQPPTEDDFVTNSLPSVATSRANRQAVFARPVTSYARVVPRVAALDSTSAHNSAPDLEADSATVVDTPTTSGPSRATFTPQVTTYLRTWLRDRMLVTGEGVPYVNEQERTDIAEHTGLSVRQVAQWFQNRRKDYAAAVRGHVDFLNTLASKD